MPKIVRVKLNQIHKKKSTTRLKCLAGMYCVLPVLLEITSVVVGNHPVIKHFDKSGTSSINNMLKSKEKWHRCI